MGISRVRGRIVVTLHADGEREDMSALLRHVLSDLIHDQGNRDIVIDLQHAELLTPAELDAICEAVQSMDERGGWLRFDDEDIAQAS